MMRKKRRWRNVINVKPARTRRGKMKEGKKATIVNNGDQEDEPPMAPRRGRCGKGKQPAHSDDTLPVVTPNRRRSPADHAMLPTTEDTMGWNHQKLLEWLQSQNPVILELNMLPVLSFKSYDGRPQAVLC